MRFAGLALAAAVAFSVQTARAAVTELGLASTSQGFELVIARDGKLYRQALNNLAAPRAAPVLFASQRTVEVRDGDFVVVTGADQSLLAYQDTVSGAPATRYVLLPHQGAATPFDTPSSDPSSTLSATSRSSGGFLAVRRAQARPRLDVLDQGALLSSVTLGASFNEPQIDALANEALVAEPRSDGRLNLQRVSLDNGAPLDPTVAVPGLSFSSRPWLVNDGTAHVLVGESLGRLAWVDITPRTLETTTVNGAPGARPLAAARDRGAAWVVTQAGGRLDALRIVGAQAQGPFSLPVSNLRVTRAAIACSTVLCAVAVAGDDGEAIQLFGVEPNGFVSGPNNVVFTPEAPSGNDAGAPRPVDPPTGVDTNGFGFNESGCRCHAGGAPPPRWSTAGLVFAVGLWLRRRLRGRPRLRDRAQPE